MRPGFNGRGERVNKMPAKKLTSKCWRDLVRQEGVNEPLPESGLAGVHGQRQSSWDCWDS